MRIFSQLRIELSACIERWSISHNNIFINLHSHAIVLFAVISNIVCNSEQIDYKICHLFARSCKQYDLQVKYPSINNYAHWPQPTPISLARHRVDRCRCVQIDERIFIPRPISPALQ